MIFTEASAWLWDFKNSSVSVFSLKQMEQNIIDLTKIEEETKEKIAAVNAEKVTIVTAFMAQMKVWIREPDCIACVSCGRMALSPSLFLYHLYSRYYWKHLRFNNFTIAFFSIHLSAWPSAESQADDGEGASGVGDGGADGREEQTGEWLQRRCLWAEDHWCKYLDGELARLRIGRFCIADLCLLVMFGFFKQKCSRLEQRKVQLTDQCKGLLKRAKAICKMQPDQSLPEDLRNVSVLHSFIGEYVKETSPSIHSV